MVRTLILARMREVVRRVCGFFFQLPKLLPREGIVRAEPLDHGIFKLAARRAGRWRCGRRLHFRGDRAAHFVDDALQLFRFRRFDLNELDAHAVLRLGTAHHAFQADAAMVDGKLQAGAGGQTQR